MEKYGDHQLYLYYDIPYVLLRCNIYISLGGFFLTGNCVTWRLSIPFLCLPLSVPWLLIYDSYSRTADRMSA